MDTYQVFISFKNTDADGQPTRDSIIAQSIFDLLSRRGLNVFFSAHELKARGTAAWRQAIDNALETSVILIVVSTTRQYLESRWVRYEWEGFSNDILSGIKPQGRIFVYAENLAVKDLPRGLRNETVISVSNDSLNVLYEYVHNGLLEIGVLVTVREEEKEEQKAEEQHGKQVKQDEPLSDIQAEEFINNDIPSERQIGLPAIEIKLDYKGQDQKPTPEKNTKKRTPTLSKKQELILPGGVAIPLVFIPAGQFTMGSDPQVDHDAETDEQPQHPIDVDEFYIGKYPVTVEQFSIFVLQAGYKTYAESIGSGYALVKVEWKWTKGADWKHPHGPLSSIVDKKNHPVTQVSWDDALGFCQWLSQLTKRVVQLPGEVEWEKSARGADARVYPWGSGLPDLSRCNFGGNIGDTTPVGQYSPYGDSPHGCTDMAGNVWEWTNSVGIAYPYPSVPREDITSRERRILRGGSYFVDRTLIRSAYRARSEPTFRCDYFGFRIMVES
jgi:formylglycine-generating enzyme required for sulfatase activity